MTATDRYGPRLGYGPRVRFFNPAAGLALVLLLLLLLPGAARAAETVLLAFGDSLTAGYGLAEAEGFAAVLERRLRARGYDVAVRNAGVSGDTTAGGRARLAWSLTPDVDAVLLELGANDALRGLAPAEARRNLDWMLAELSRRHLPVLLAGMLAPRNLGPDYAAEFDAIYPELAERHSAALYPFFLEGVARRPELNQADGIHPNAAGVQAVVQAMLPYVERLLAQADGRP